MTVELMVGNSIVLQQVPPYLQDTVASIIAALPAIIAAIIILIIGWIVGRVLGSVVRRAVEGIGLSGYAEGTPLEARRDAESSIADALGRTVKYIIYLLAILLALQQVSLPIPADILTTITNAGLRIIEAAIILVVGFAIGRFVGNLLGDLLSEFGFERYVAGTPLARATDSVGGMGSAIGRIIEYIIYYFAIAQAIGALQFGVLTRLFTGLTIYLPILIGALIILAVGIYVADLVGGIIARSNTSRATDYVGLGVEVLIYYITATIVLHRLGLQVEVLRTLFNSAVVAFFGALGVGLAIAIGIGVGWGSKEFVADNIDRWFGQARDSASEVTEEGSGSSSGSNTGFGSDFESPDSDDDGPGGSGPSGTDSLDD